MWREFDSTNDSHPTKFERRPRILAKASFRELCHSKFSVYLLLIIWPFHWVKKEVNIVKVGCDFMRHQSLDNFCDTHWGLIYCNIWHPGTLGISTTPEIAIGTLFYLLFGYPKANCGPLTRGQSHHPDVNHCVISCFDLKVTDAWHGTKTSPVFLHSAGEASWSYFQVWSPYYQTAQSNQKTNIPGSLRWQNQKGISTNINHSHYQRSSTKVSLNWSNDSDSVLTNPVGKDGVRG